MSNLKNKISKELINPAIKYSGITLLEGVVLKTHRGKYDIELIDEKGTKKTVNGVIARVYGNDIPGAYPVNTTVSIMYDADNKSYEVVGQVITDYESYKQSYEIEKDIYSSISCDYLLGNIY